MKTHKFCPRCKKVKSIDQFPKNRASYDSVGSYCKPCSSVISAESNRKHRKRRNMYMREWRKKHPNSHREGFLKREYDLSIEDYEKYLSEQNGGCYICGRKPQDKKLLHVDHNHKTGEIRGLLCQQCNHAIGLFQENEAIIKKAAKYISRRK